MSKYIYETRMEVRDYECDIEGIVNNANYLHYTEHTRHLFLKHCGLSFAEMHEKGVDAVVARMNLQYKTPYAVTMSLSRVCGWRSKASNMSSIRTSSVLLMRHSVSVETSHWSVWLMVDWQAVRTMTVSLHPICRKSDDSDVYL